MPNSPSPLSSRARLALFLTTLGLLTLIAAVIWTYYAPEAPAIGAGAAGAETAGAETMAAVVSFPTPLSLPPTPVITPLAGHGGRISSSSDGLLPTPTLLPELAAAVDLAEPEQAAMATTAWPTLTAVPPTQEPPTSIPPTETSLPEASGIELPQRLPVNGIRYETIVVLPDNVLQHAREIYLAGKVIGRNPHAFSKVGDSTIEEPHFLVRYDSGPYDLGQYASLQPAVDFFHGSHSRNSEAVHVGLHAWTVNDPTWADKSVCLPNESPLDCEIRLNNPSILLIRLGTNDVGVPSIFDSNMRHIVETAIADGVIPVIGTKADRHEGSNENNDILRQIAADYEIPLWDFDAVANTLPGRGLDEDAAHMLTFFSHDFSDPIAFTRGHAMHNLTALMMLDALWREVMQGGS